jgi:broad specificity phosphatase PhoE
MPVVQPGVPGELWELGEEGRLAGRVLAAAAPQRAYYAASPEPKALQTVQEMSAGQVVIVDPAFREARRPPSWTDDYRTRARGYIDGACLPGWEPQGEVAARFEAAISRHARIASDRRQALVVGTHGLAPVLWLASRLRLHPSPGEFWESLEFPDLIDVDLGAARAGRRRFSAIDASPSRDKPVG